MRQIKFRVWDGDAKVMTHSGGLRQFLIGGASSDVGLGIELHWSVKNSYRGWHRERNFSADLESGILVMEQFTGLQDKNGKDIYEGDICRFHIFVSRTEPADDLMPREIYQIIWLRSAWGFAPLFPDAAHEDDKEPKAFYRDPFEGDDWSTDYFEVIGNIHENPELLP